MQPLMRTISWVLLLAGVCSLSACDAIFDPEPPEDNQLPGVRLADNAPVEGDTLFALATLHWDGQDADGFVQGYEYRYITTYCSETGCASGDSVITDWTPTDATSETIAFNSKAPVNKQIFQVRAIDNVGAVSEPAERVFYTLRTVPPTATLVSPTDEQQLFVQDATTDWWPGVPITFTARAGTEDATVVSYGWGVDGGPWHWTQDTSIVIPPSVFTQGGQPLEGTHTIQVTARDNTNLVAHEGPGAARRSDTVRVELIRPSFDRDILIVDETLEEESPFSQLGIGDATVDSFYADVFGTDNSWDYSEKGIPPREVLGRYRLVIWHADNTFSSASNAHRLPQNTAVIGGYMNVGGDFLMSGWQVLKSFRPDAEFPQAFGDTTFVNQYLHILRADETPVFPADFVGALGVGEDDSFTDVKVDSAKIADSFLYSEGLLSQINVVPTGGEMDGVGGFTEIIYSYDSAGQVPTYRGYAVGLQYHGTVFDAVVLGFPLFFIEEDDARVLGQEVLQSLGY